MDDENRAAKRAAQLTEKMTASLASALAENRTTDSAVALLKRAVALLENDLEVTREAACAFLRGHLDLLSAGPELPTGANAEILRADELGVPRDVLVAAAKRAGLAKRGADPKKNMRDRLAETRRIEEEGRAFDRAPSSHTVAPVAKNRRRA